MKSHYPAINDAEVDVGEADDPVAAVGLGDADGLSRQRLADEDRVAAPFDGPVSAHPALRQGQASAPESLLDQRTDGAR